MKKELMDILACPVCKGELTLTVTKEDGEEIVEGSLRCDACGAQHHQIEDAASRPDESAEIIMDYKVTGFPTSIFVNSDGSIQRNWTGILNLEKMEELVSEIIN